MKNVRIKEWKNFIVGLRGNRPLIHHITNNVTMNFLANGVLAAGGSPMMVHDALEVEEAVAVSKALVLNIGTLEEKTAHSMKLALRQAMKSGIPIVLDPVGVGLSSFRQNTVKELLTEYSELKGDCPQTILTICGNAAEMQFLAGLGWGGKGVDGEIDGSIDTLVDLARTVAKQSGCLIAMTGETDVVTDGETVIELSHGHPMLSFVTGTGCFTTSMVALYQAHIDIASEGMAHLEKTALAILMLTKAAEEAVEISNGPGSFKENLLDGLYRVEQTESIWNGDWKVRGVDFFKGTEKQI